MNIHQIFNSLRKLLGKSALVTRLAISPVENSIVQPLIKGTI